MSKAEVAYLPEHLQTLDDLLVFLRGRLYELPISYGKRRKQKTAWKQMRLAALWSDFHPVVLEYLAPYGFDETKYNYHPTWEAVLQSGENCSCGTYSKIVSRFGLRKGYDQSTKDCIKAALRSWGTKRGYIVRPSAYVNGVRQFVIRDFCRETLTAKMRQTNTPCFVRSGTLLLPCWKI